MSNSWITGICLAAALFAAPAIADLPQDGAETHMGVATCAASQCHGSAVPREGSNVAQNEYVVWTRDDPHAKAYEVLGNELSRAIASRLGIGSPLEADVCLDCHADNVATSKRGERFQLSDGVGCEACHGGAEQWLASHYNTAGTTHADNVAAGLYPGEESTRRAELCLSCHLGTENKFATHQMMAAGHPRLAFELDTFTELWRTAGRQPHFVVDADYAERKGAVDHTKVWADGLLAEGRQRLALVRSGQFANDNIFPELALYDCHACHRSMKTVQWQALPRHGDVGPGMPFLTDGAFVMILALVEAIAPERTQEYQDALAALHVASSASQQAIDDAAGNLDLILRELQNSSSASRLQNAERRILEQILQSGARGEFLDYASAEQAFMAVQMLVIEIGDSSLEAQLDELANALEDDERYRPAEFADLLQAMGEN